MAQLFYLLAAANFVLLVSCSQRSYVFSRASSSNIDSSTNEWSDISTNYESNGNVEVIKDYDSPNEDIEVIKDYNGPNEEVEVTKDYDGPNEGIKVINNDPNEKVKVISDDPNEVINGGSNKDIGEDSNDESSEDSKADSNEGSNEGSNDVSTDYSNYEVNADSSEGSINNSNYEVNEDSGDDVSDRNDSTFTDEDTTDKNELVCEDSEVVDECPADCPSNYCPKSENESQSSCPNPDPCPEPACKCRFNYRRTSNETCIPTRDCPPFDCSARPNEEFDPCPPYCPSDDCSQASPTGRCPLLGRIGIVLECKPKCRCKKNYWRLDGICVPYEECPGVCPTNEIYSDCINGLRRSLDCFQASQKDFCIPRRREPCKKGCVCQKKYFRGYNGTCVPLDQCESTKQSCPPNEEIDECANAICRAQNCTQKGLSVACPAVSECIKDCVCKENFLRSENGSCVPQDQCPKSQPTCPPNEEIDECANAICRDQYCTQKGMPVACPAVSKCITDCVCKENFLRSENGSCIPQDLCPIPQGHICPINEEYSECTIALCRALNCSQKGEPVPCPSVSEGSCDKGCVCKGNYLRNENGTCVPEDQCTTTTKLECGDNEVVANCTADCPSDYCPTSEDQDQSCPTPEVCPPPTCKCRFNYRRAPNGTCIPTRQCPSFNCDARPNEEFNSCPPLCPTDDCSQASPDGKCPLLGRIGIILPCTPQCRCIKNYWKKDGVCVPYGECPGVCPPNEVFSDCINATCTRLNCTQKIDDKNCTDKKDGPCEKGCVCQDKYLRADNGTCVPEDQCEKPKPICGANEVVDNCPSDCSSDYCPKSESDGKNCITPNPCPPPACKCRFNLKRADNGTCIPTRQCPPFSCSSRPNEEYNPCPALCPTEDCSQAKLHGRCPFRIGIVLHCNPKCRCIKEHYRRDGICVPYGECPGICPNNEEYSECINKINRPLNCSEVDRPKPSKIGNTTEEPCQKGCVCLKNYYRDNNGTCVPEEQCKTTTETNNTCTGPYEQYTDCKKTCPSDLCVSITSKRKCLEIEAVCEPGCACMPGYFRRNETQPCGPVCDCLEMAGSADCPKQ